MRRMLHIQRMTGAIMCGRPNLPDGTETGRVTNSEVANRYIRREYRQGWSL